MAIAVHCLDSQKMCMGIFHVDPSQVNRVPAPVKHFPDDFEPRYVSVLRPRQTNRGTQAPRQYRNDQCVSHAQYLLCWFLLIQITQSATRTLPVNLEGKVPWCGLSLL